MRHSFSIAIVCLKVMFTSCTTNKPEQAISTNTYPNVFPNDFGATIPLNIAPVNLRFNDECEQLYIMYTGKKSSLEFFFNDNKTKITTEKWSSFLNENQGDSIAVTLFSFHNKQWYQHKSFSYFVSSDAIDGYLIYRLIQPGYQTWNFMGIYERSLSDFNVKTILDSRLMQHTCMNCHSMAANNPDNMLLHLRENNSGTILMKNGKVEKLNTKTANTFSSVSFPYWHPSAKYIAFSIDKVRQLFPACGQERAHGFDKESDMVIYDVNRNEFFTSPLIFSKDAYEAFPCFSADGKKLYFITAPAKPMPQEIQKIRYSLCSIDFDPATATLGTTVDTLISASKLGKSVTMPRISPNGKQIIVTMTNHGNFPAYNTDADLYSYNLSDSTFTNAKLLNSKDVESYHSWSSNGKWLVFSSRRMDGLYMNAYLAHVDDNGNFSKPFLLPQEDADFHKSFLYSFNIPEFSIKPVTVSPYQIEDVAKNSNETQVVFDSSH